MTTKSNQEWKKRIEALHPSYFVKEGAVVDEAGWNHDKKGTIEMVEEAMEEAVKKAIHTTLNRHDKRASIEENYLTVLQCLTRPTNQ